jgi:hypothetical protein
VRFFVNEVYELSHLEKVELTQDKDSGKFSYKPGPQDVLRLEIDGHAGKTVEAELARSSQFRLLRSILLVLVGILLGGGFVFLFFLAD